MRTRLGHFSVNPRYSAGSGAMVDERTALQVAKNERDGYEHALEGVYGKDAQERAKKLGLVGVAEHLTETRKGWEVRDLCTGKTYARPFSTPRRRRS